MHQRAIRVSFSVLYTHLADCHCLHVWLCSLVCAPLGAYWHHCR